MHMQAIIKAFRSAATLAVQQVKDSSISIAGKDEEEKRDMLQKCASTTLNSKLVGPSPVLCCSGVLLLLGTCVHVLEVVVFAQALSQLLSDRLHVLWQGAATSPLWVAVHSYRI